MEKLLQKFKKRSNIWMLVNLSWFVLCALLFGDFSGISKFVLLPVSVIILFLILRKQINYIEKKRRFFDDVFFYFFTLGFLLSSFELSPFLLTVREPIITLTINSSFGIIGWWVCFFGCAFSHFRYKENKVSEYMESFDNSDSMERDIKIEKIIKKWYE